jgi:hypothetical protein
MIKYDYIQKTMRDPVEKICDHCGLACKRDELPEFQEFHSIVVEGGYGSIFGDGSFLTADFCQHCAMKLFGKYLKPFDMDPVEDEQQ